MLIINFYTILVTNKHTARLVETSHRSLQHQRYLQRLADPAETFTRHF